MPAPSNDTIAIPADRLRLFVENVCRRAGCDAEETTALAEHLVDANLAGHDSHGVGMLTDYVPAMLEGRLKLGRRSRVVRDQGAVVVVEGGLGVGQVLGREAMTIGIARARQHGVALVALRRSHHLGRIGAWAELCAAAGCVSMHYVVAQSICVAPFGGRDGRLATNPICIGLPSTSRPSIILDMATSKLAFGKVKVARNKGRRVPEGVLIDTAGEPTTDPAVMFASPMGALLPFGEYKGYGLALMCALLAGALAGGGIGRPETQVSKTIVNSMLSVVIDPAALSEGSAWKAEVDALSAWVTSSPVRPGFDAVMVPGDPERRARAERERSGIPLDRNTWRQLLDVAAAVGCASDEIPAVTSAS